MDYFFKDKTPKKTSIVSEGIALILDSKQT